MLHIGFDEINFFHIYPLYLHDSKIGEVTINRYPNTNIFEVFHIELDTDYRGNYYLPKFLELLESQAKQEQFRFLKLRWVKLNKIESLKRRGYSVIPNTESMIKEI